MTDGIHIYVATGTHYRIRTQMRGFRRWHSEGGKFKSLTAAAVRLARIMASLHDLNRGEVLLCADYYDPTPVLTMERP